MRPGVDIVVPAGPGDRSWCGLLPQLDNASANQIVLVLSETDGFDQDHVPANLKVCKSPAGRAKQLNAGARVSDSSWIWFVHADSRVVAATLQVMQRFIAGEVSAIGYFDLRFLDDGPRWTVFNAWGAQFRSRVLGLPFGDQGLLIPRGVFDALGGFDETVGAGEDHDLIWSARAHGIRVRPVGAPIFTSARKYAEHGWWRTTREHLGMTREQAARFSRRHDSRNSMGQP